MKLSLAEMITECILAKNRLDASQTDNAEFALFFIHGSWQAHIGNPVQAVMLGETEGEFNTVGDTPEEAVEQLLAELVAAK